MSNRNKDEVQLVPAHDLKPVLEENTGMAVNFYKYLVDQKKGLEKNGKRYIEFTEWQTLGNMYDVDVETYLIGPCIVHGDKGMHAKAEVIHTPTGKRVGYAEAMAFKSEKGKGGHTWNQIGSMAQTRAGSKAMKNAIGWIVELAGISSTPLEEMENIQPDKKGEESPLVKNLQKKKAKEAAEKAKKEKEAKEKSKGKTKDKQKDKENKEKKTEETTEEKTTEETESKESNTDEEEPFKQDDGSEVIPPKKEEKTKSKTDTLKKKSPKDQTAEELVLSMKSLIDSDGEAVTKSRVLGKLNMLKKGRKISLKQLKEATKLVKTMDF